MNITVHDNIGTPKAQPKPIQLISALQVHGAFHKSCYDSALTCPNGVFTKLFTLGNNGYDVILMDDPDWGKSLFLGHWNDGVTPTEVKLKSIEVLGELIFNTNSTEMLKEPQSLCYYLRYCVRDVSVTRISSRVGYDYDLAEVKIDGSTPCWIICRWNDGVA